ncbi:spherulation-specific family 4 protein [Candidatus Nitrosotalea okcheonensis]|nr:spherulation-specific family 4 protein [Candidatus Nitrosotalea okcheonensis]
MKKHNRYRSYWLILIFSLILISSSLVITLSSKTLTNTATGTLVPTQIVSLHNTTRSTDLSARLGGNATGIYYPLYSLSELPQVLAAKQAFPNVPFMVNINPSSGPGSSASAAWATAITQLKSAGAVVTGYVPTGYGTGRTISNVEGMISSYNQFYPNMLDGIMFDEVSGSCSEFSFYQTVSNYARSLGYSYIRANPGSSICQTDVPLFNHIAIYESAGYPSESTLASNTYYPQYSKSVVGFGATVHTQPTYDPTWLHMATKYLKWVYITDQTEPNPYAVFPAYFNQYLTYLTILQKHHHFLSVNAVDTDGRPIHGMGIWLEMPSGDIIKKAFTPHTFTVKSDAQYRVVLANFREHVFDHWQDQTNNTDRHRIIFITGNTTLVGVYLEQSCHINQINKCNESDFCLPWDGLAWHNKDQDHCGTNRTQYFHR